MSTFIAKRSTLGMLLGGIFFALLLATPIASEAAAPLTKHCGTLDQSKGAPPAGYGAAYDVFEPTKLQVRVFCPTDAGGHTTAILIGSGGPNEIVYNKAYYYVTNPTTRVSSWKELNLVGGGGFYNGDSTSGWRYTYGVGYVGALDSTETPGDIQYIVGYVCKSVDGQWKCGCSDTTCADRKWQLQIIGTGADRVADTGPGTYCQIASERRPGEVIEYTVRKFGNMCGGLPGNYYGGAYADGCAIPQLELSAGTMPEGVRITVANGPFQQPVNHNFATAWKNLSADPANAPPGTYSFTLENRRYIRNPDGDDPVCVFSSVNWSQDYRVTVLPPAEYIKLAPIVLADGRVGTPYHTTMQLPNGYRNWESLPLATVRQLACCGDATDTFPPQISTNSYPLVENSILDWYGYTNNPTAWQAGTYRRYIMAIRKSDGKQVAFPITIIIRP